MAGNKQAQNQPQGPQNASSPAKGDAKKLAALSKAIQEALPIYLSSSSSKEAKAKAKHRCYHEARQMASRYLIENHREEFDNLHSKILKIIEEASGESIWNGAKRSSGSGDALKALIA